MRQNTETETGRIQFYLNIFSVQFKKLRKDGMLAGGFKLKRNYILIEKSFEL